MVPQYQPQRALDLFSRWIGVEEAPDAPTGAASPKPQTNPATKQPERVATERNPIGADRSADEVKSLPGWEGPLPSKHYSGYLDVGLSSSGPKDIHIHYWLSESEGDPSTDPVVFWMNGGPGGSGLIGGLTENGPFYMDDSSFSGAAYNESGVPTLKSRPERWNRLANTVYVETPAMTVRCPCSWTLPGLFLAPHADGTCWGRGFRTATTIARGMTTRRRTHTTR